jgi:restriction system protein
MTEPSTTSGETSVPIWPALIVPVLQALESGETFPRKNLFHVAAEKAGLSAATMQEMLESGGLRYEQRMGWVLSHLTRAKWIDRPARGQYAINETGRQWLNGHPGGMTYSEANTVFAPFWPKKLVETAPVDGPVADLELLDPIEQIENGVNLIHADVASNLIERLRASDPAFFEQAVVDLLLMMGYGGAEQRGKRIGGSGDGGVDGVIDQDPLGLDKVYVQAKRYAEGKNISREMVQAFVGALQGFGTSKGVFITTSAFTSHAAAYAASVPSRVILIDAERLAALMIKYRVGVQVKESYDVVELDEDFFE